jgi:hypothetical protein
MTTATQLPPGILKALRKATDITIKFNARDIILIPHVKVKKVGGGVDWVAQAPRPSQRFNIEPVESTLAGITATGAGESASVAGGSAKVWYYFLTARFDAEIEINDRWQDGNTKYEIQALQPFNGYSKNAIVQAFGSDPNYGS